MDKIELAKWGSHLSSRRIGAEVKNILNNSLLAGLPLTLDFANVETISNSFADELVAKTVQMVGQERFSKVVTIKNASQNVKNQLIFSVNNRLSVTN